MSEEIKKGNTDMEALNDDLLEEASGGLASRNFFAETQNSRIMVRDTPASRNEQADNLSSRNGFADEMAKVK